MHDYHHHHSRTKDKCMKTRQLYYSANFYRVCELSVFATGGCLSFFQYFSLKNVACKDKTCYKNISGDNNEINIMSK